MVGRRKVRELVGIFATMMFVSCGPLGPVSATALIATGCSSRHRKHKRPSFYITTNTLPEGEVGVTYGPVTLRAEGGTGTYTWSDVNGVLASCGLVLDPSTGEISGTPSQSTPAGGIIVTIEVQDSAATPRTAKKDFTLIIYPELQITTTSLPNGYDGQTGYSATLTATGGTGTYTWSITSGDLPQNLSLDPSTGEISGDIASNASANSPYNFTVEVTDGLGTKQANLSITVYEELQITTTTLPDAYEGVSYSYTLTASGGNSANYTWSISGQPAWLSIDSSSGELSGTPPAGSAGNTYTFTVTVDDGLQNANKQFDLVVNSAVAPTADFEATPTSGTAPLNVTFTDKSTGTITQWEWDFDNDGVTDSTDQNPTWTYSNPGWYTVKLTVTGPAGSDSCVKEMLILVANNIWYVDGVRGSNANGGTGWGDAFNTIGKALSVAGDYDLVLVADTTYNETNLNFNGKKIYLKGVDHNNAGQRPVIDCQSSGRAFYFGSGETGDCVIDNFVIQNGSAQDGGAIYCDSSSPTITNCTFSGNGANWYGGAIRCRDSSSPSITNCTFSGNSANWYGGAIACYNSSSPSITNCTFSGNSAGFYGGAIHCENSSSPTITNCTFSGNSTNCYGGAIRCDGSSPTVTNCTFSGNSAGDDGGAIYCGNSSSPTLNNCILWGNNASKSGNEVYCSSSSSCTLNYCCVDNTGYGGETGNIDDSNNCVFSDPQFVSAPNDLHLQSTSPCIDAGDNSLVPAGLTTDWDGNPRIVDGNNDGDAVVDIGAYEYQP